MSEVFGSDFNNGGADWTSATGSFVHIGENFTRCLSCDFGQVYQDLPASYQQGSARLQFASIPGSNVGGALLVAGGPYAGSGLGDIKTITSLVNPTPLDPRFKEFGVLVALGYGSGDTTQGQIVFIVNRGGDTAPPGVLTGGAFPRVNPWTFATAPQTLHTGAWHGFQMRFVYDAVAQTMTIVAQVDNVEVGNFAFSTVGWRDGISGPWPLDPLGPNRVFAYNAKESNGLHYIVENYHFDDTAQVFNWPGLTNAPTLIPTSCDTPQNIAAVTNLSPDCNATPVRMIVDGVNFQDDATIDLQGPGGTVAFSVVPPRSSTRLVLGSLNPPFVDGTYCATVTNPFP